MAAGKPIVASDLPSVRTVLNADNAYLVPPDDSQALAQGIRDALSQQQQSTRKAERAREDVKQYTWEKRAEKILNFVSETSPKLEKRVASGAVSYSDG
jgi:glycosyltransferase involved in cell wall biosynthesis